LLKSKKTEPERRKAEDIALVNELCKITGTNKQTVKNVTRLGKNNIYSEIPRPMRVMFEDEKAKGSLMANMKNLSTAEDKFKQLSITHDMTKKERLQNKEKFAEAKNKNEVLEENSSSRFSYYLKYLLHLSSTSFSILRFFIAFSSQGGQYQCRSDRLVSSLYSVLLNLTQERQKWFSQYSHSNTSALSSVNLTEQTLHVHPSVLNAFPSR
jgi:hypothetical protein